MKNKIYWKLTHIEELKKEVGEMLMDRYWVGQIFNCEDRTTYGETQMLSYNSALSDISDLLNKLTK